ncbi:MAG: hypothetical protein ACRDID_06740, partial [Ktedonobacterales bacterium]
PWGAHARLNNDGQLITAAPGDESAALNLFLIQAGFTPRAIAPQEERLEDVFLRLTGDGAASAERVNGVDGVKGGVR